MNERVVAAAMISEILLNTISQNSETLICFSSHGNIKCRCLRIVCSGSPHNEPLVQIPDQSLVKPSESADSSEDDKAGRSGLLKKMLLQIELERKKEIGKGSVVCWAGKKE